MVRMGPVHELRIDETYANAEDGTADSDIDGGDSNRCKPELPDAYADVFGFLRIVAQRFQMQPKGRVHNPPHQEGAKRQEHKAVIVEGPDEKLDLVVLGEL